MPLPRISLSSRLPTVTKSEKILRALHPKTICSTPSPTQFPPPSHEHIAHLIRDQKSASEALQTFRWASKLPNFTHNQCTYRSLIYKLCVFRRFEDVDDLLDEMPSSIGCPPDEDIFVTIVRGLGRAQRIREVIKVPALVQRFGLAPSLKIYNTILDVLVKEDIDIARRFFREKMMECSVHGDDYTFGILMKGLSLTNRIGDGFKLLQVMKTRGLTPNTTIYNTLLHALCKNGKVGRARSLMSTMTAPNDVTYNLMISAYCKEKNLVQAQVLLEKSFASGFVPDNVTVTKVMNLLCSVGRAHEAAEVLERTENNGGRVDVVAYNILIRGFCSIEKAKVGVHFKKQMENKGILPNVDTYNALIAGFCNVDLLDSALDLFNEMKADAIDCNLVTYDTLIKGFCSKGRVEEGFQFLEEMEESKGGSRGHISPYNSIICGLYLQSRYVEALDFLNKMGRMFPRAVDRTLRILGLCNEGKIASAKEVYDQMIHEGGVPSVLVYSSLIEGFCEHKLVREAFELMNEMVGRGYIPGTSIYNAIIAGFCRQGKIRSALKLVEDISGKGFLLNVGTFSPLINALCSKGDLRRAMKIFEQMADEGILPDSCTWNSLLNCLNLETENVLSLNARIQWVVQT